MWGINIPSSFELFGTTICVEYREMVDHLGYSDYENRKIIINPKCSNELQREVFYHEKTHWLFYKMGSVLEGNEKFIGMFGDLLYQSVKTEKFKIQSASMEGKINETT